MEVWVGFEPTRDHSQSVLQTVPLDQLRHHTIINGSTYGIRIRVADVKNLSPSPLDECAMKKF